MFGIQLMCLMASQGITMTEAMRTILFHGARIMAVQDKKVIGFASGVTGEFKGQIRTDFKYVPAFDAILFEADIQSRDGPTKATFLVRREDLEGPPPEQTFWTAYRSGDGLPQVSPQIMRHMMFN